MQSTHTSEGPYDLVVIGSGFGSLFFVDGYLGKHPQARVLILVVAKPLKA